MGHFGFFESQFPSHHFVVGEVIYGELGMCFSESGKFAVEKVHEDGYLDLVEVGGEHRRVPMISPNMRGISRKFGIGYYYEDREAPEIVTKATIAQLVAEAKEERKRQEAEAEAKAKADAEYAEQLKVEYPYLIKVGEGKREGWLSTAEVAKNIRLILKNLFPKEKFSVRKESYGCINVECRGEVRKEVEKVVYRFQDHHSDYTGDYWDYSPSVFNKVFGGVEFVFVNRYGERL